MKKMICAAAMLLAATSLTLAQNNALQISATGTGNTTGHIANLSLYNPTNQPVTAEIGACFIPSGGQYQPYIVPNVTTATVPPHSTANAPVNGYCTDIHTPPVPSGSSMPPVKNWITVAETPPANWSPSTANGWRPAPGSAALVPGTDRPLGHTIDPQKHPTEAAGILLDALTRIADAYDKMKNEGAITTPFSGTPEKEREAVIQQTFWRYASALTGKEYKVEDFSKNTIEQFEASTGQKWSAASPAARKNVEQGVADFWSTFEAVGAEAKVLSSVTGATTGGNPPELISVEDALCECGAVTFDAEVSVKPKGGEKGKPQKFSFDSGSTVRNTLKAELNPGDEVLVTLTNLVTKCTDCKEGPCQVRKDSREVSYKTEGFEESTDKQTKKPKGYEKLGGRETFEPPAGTVGSSSPMHFYVKVVYVCENAKCVERKCEKVFDITVEKEKKK